MARLKIRVSPLEKPYVFDELDQMGVDYIKEEFYIYCCLICGRLYKDKSKQCECGSEEIISEQCGDIIGWNYNYIIERKKGKDLIASLSDDRLYTQLRIMSEYFDGCCALVFEGRFEDVVEEERKRLAIQVKQGKLSERQMNGRFAQLMSIPATCVQYGVSFIQVKDLRQLVKMLKYFDYKCGTEPKIRLKRHKLHKLIPDYIKRLTVTDGISLELALRINEQFPDEESLKQGLRSGSILAEKKVKGIAKGKYELLRKSWNV